jgi:N-acetyl-gamma-glutamyl-phosphate reductase
MRIGIIGASGYSGGELLRYLENHPVFTVDYIAAGSNAGSSITSLHPQLHRYAGRSFEETSINRANQVDLLFMALPHGQSAPLAAEISEQVKIVDLGADFRLADPSAWERFYGGAHAGTWVYGLPELDGNRERIASSNRIANPGCYATAVAIAAAPFISAGVIAAPDITVVAASGTTGAGRSAKTHLLGSEVMGSLSSYKFGGHHQHIPEMEQTLRSVQNFEGDLPQVSFTPILAPMPRGILATVTSKTTSSSENELKQILRDYYDKEPFIHLLEGEMPRTSAVIGSNNVQIAIALDHHTSRWIASVAIDNLGKGAAGQAIQNANLIAGLDERTALMGSGLGA